MENKVKTWLQDILFAISEIHSFLPESLVFEEVKKDIKTVRAIERNLEIIGEAVNRILKEHPEIEITDAQKIVDTRNRIIHGYDSVSFEIIWAITIRSLPVLEKEIDALMKDSA